jgi:putative membrane protein
MRLFIASWFVNSLALYLVARFLPGIRIQNLLPSDGGFITQQGLISVLLGGLIIGVFNAILFPILNFLSLPLRLLTLGLFSFIVSGTVFALASLFIPGMHIAGFWWAVGGSMLFGFLNSLMSGILGIGRCRD